MEGVDGGVDQPRAGGAEGQDGEVDVRGAKCVGVGLQAVGWEHRGLLRFGCRPGAGGLSQGGCCLLGPLC